MFVGNSSDKVFLIDHNGHAEPTSQLSNLKTYLNNGFKFVANDRPHELLECPELETIQTLATNIFREYAESRSILRKILDWVVSFFTKSEYDEQHEVIEQVASLILERNDHLQKTKSYIESLGFKPNDDQEAIKLLKTIQDEIDLFESKDRDNTINLIAKYLKDPLKYLKIFVERNHKTLQEVILRNPNFSARRENIEAFVLSELYFNHRDLMIQLKLLPDCALNDIASPASRDADDMNLATKYGFKPETPGAARRALVSIKHSLQGPRRNHLYPELKHSEVLDKLRSYDNQSKIEFINRWYHNKKATEVYFDRFFIIFMLLDPNLVVKTPFINPSVNEIAALMQIEFPEHTERLSPCYTTVNN